MTKVSCVKFTSNLSEFTENQNSVNSYFLVPVDYKSDSFTSDIDKKYASDSNKKKHKAIKIIGGILGGAFIIFGTIRVMPKSIIKRFDLLKEYFVNRADEVTTSSKMAIFYRKQLSRMRNIAEKTRGFNNFVSFKDIWFQRAITDKVPLLKKCCDKITNLFDKTGQSVVKKTYRSALKKFDKLNHLYTNAESEILKEGEKYVTINGVKRSKSEWVEVLAQKRQQLFQILNSNYSDEKIIERNKRLKKIMSGLGDKVWAESFGKEGSFRKKDTYFTFWADKFLAKDKVNFADDINKVRVSIKFGRHDKVRVCEDILASSKKFIHPQDVASEKIMRELNKLLSEYNGLINKNPAALNDLAPEILKKINEFDKILVHGKDTYKYDDSILNAIKIRNEQIKKIFTSGEHGCIDEINEIYRALLDEKEFKHLKNASKNAVDYLDNSIRKETNDYFDKLRDWTLGAAPTDVLGVLFGFGSMGAAIALTNDKEKRKSIALKAGIPAIGGAAVMMFMTARLTSGAKGLLAGIASSFVLNKIGVFVDKKYKQLSVKNNA